MAALVSVGFDETAWEVDSEVEVGAGFGCSGLVSSGACAFELGSLFVSVDRFSESWVVKSISKVPLFPESHASHSGPKPFASNFGNDPISTSFLYPSLYLQTDYQLG